MEARNRKIEDWYGKILRGEIKLPRFQRFEAWDLKRISSLINTISQNLPLGITLVLEIGEKEPFISRYLATAPTQENKVMEHLLDGQQRLTALWRVLQNNYDSETYYIYVPEFDEYGERNGNEQMVFCKTRYKNKKLERYPLWCDMPHECLKRGMIPTNLLKPVDIQNEIDDWLNHATQPKKPDQPEHLEEFFNWKKQVSDKVKDLRAVIKNYNLPFLSLPSSTSKDTTLDVFINMNTNSKPLSPYDIIVAEVESVKGKSLHELQNDLDNRHPDIKNYFELSYLILNTSALLQEKLPNQRGLWDMDKSIMVDNWNDMEKGLAEMASFLLHEGVIDREGLPTNAVLSVIAALYPFISEKGDLRGMQEILLKKYLWSAFFTDRYENSAATHAFADYIALKRVITNALKENGEPYTESDIPILNKTNYPIANSDELLTVGWPKRETIRGKAILCVTCRLGSYDFATGLRIDRSNISNRHYHHIFPDALLSESEIESYLALNCALIADSTNLNIGKKEPLKYLKERYQWVSQDIVNERLNSHLIPVDELATGGYEHLTAVDKKEKLTKDFNFFLNKRSRFFARAASLLADGMNISASNIIESPTPNYYA